MMPNDAHRWPPLDNPFATRWVTPGAIRYHFPKGDSLPELLARIAEHEGRGAIIGPHGTGKSTLIATVASDCERRGIAVSVLRTHDGGQPSLSSILSAARDVTGGLLIVDGFEALAALVRRATSWACRYQRCGLLVSSHASTFLPTVMETASSLRIATRLARRLWQHSQHRAARPTHDTEPLARWSPAAATDLPLTAACIRHCYQESAGNLREFFFHLYDECERLRRGTRSAHDS